MVPSSQQKQSGAAGDVFCRPVKRRDPTFVVDSEYSIRNALENDVGDSRRR
jgi:hypothetical protein